MSTSSDSPCFLRPVKIPADNKHCHQFDGVGSNASLCKYGLPDCKCHSALCRWARNKNKKQASDLHQLCLMRATNRSWNQHEYELITCAGFRVANGGEGKDLENKHLSFLLHQNTQLNQPAMPPTGCSKWHGEDHWNMSAFKLYLHFQTVLSCSV